MPKSLRFLMLLMPVILLSWGIPGNPLNRYEISGFAQGTTYHIVYYATSTLVTQQQTDQLLHKIDTSVSLYLPGSLIVKFNQSAKGLYIDDVFKALILKALEVSNDTDGAVDVTVKPLVDAWGFGATKPRIKPDSSLINTLLKQVGKNKIWLSGNYLHKSNRGVQIDLNGIAQGYTADLLAQLLQRKNVHSYMAEIGGELRVNGLKPDGKPFTIGIEGVDGNDMLPTPLRKVITLSSGAVTTSGNYRNFIESGGKKIAHLIDPRTGYPANNEMISVTVIAKDGITADGYDNGFMVMGLHKTLKMLADRSDMGAYIVYRNKNGAVADTATKEFIKYMHNN